MAGNFLWIRLLSCFRLYVRAYDNNLLELVRVDVTISILVEEVESLSQSFALVTLDELGEFGVWDQLPDNKGYYPTHIPAHVVHLAARRTASSKSCQNRKLPISIYRTEVKLH